MSVSFKKLWIMLIEKELTKEDLVRAKLLSRATITKMNRGEIVSLAILVNICHYFNCDIGDIMEVLQKGKMR